MLSFVTCGKLMLCERDHPSAAMALLMAAEQLSLSELSRAAEAQLISCIGHDSVCGLLQWADAYLGGGGGSSSSAPAPAPALPPQPPSFSALSSVGFPPLFLPPSSSTILKPPFIVLTKLEREEGEAEEAPAQLSSAIRGNLAGVVLRAACMSHILRYFEAITSGEDFLALPEHIQREVMEAARSTRHAYALDIAGARSSGGSSGSSRSHP